jgi:hypothetical protein
MSHCAWPICKIFVNFKVNFTKGQTQIVLLKLSAVDPYFTHWNLRELSHFGLPVSEIYCYRAPPFQQLCCLGCMSVAFASFRWYGG